MIHLSKNQPKATVLHQSVSNEAVHNQTTHCMLFTVLQAVNMRVGLLVAIVSLLTGLSGCSSTKENITPANTGESISYKVDGKAYADKSPTFLGDADYFSLFSVVAISSSVNSPGYILKLEMDKPKVGTFTAQSGLLSGSLGYVKSLNDVLSYDMSSKTGGTLTFTKYDPNGFAEGTFSFVGKTDKGQTVTVTDGTFRINVK